MLKKLMKYEVVATSRFFLLMYAGLILLSIINSLLFNRGNSLYSSMMQNNFLYQLFSFFSVLLYAGLICGIFVGNTFLMVQRYYKNMLGDEGYLMHTLPVKSWQHIAAKTVVSAMWLFASILLTIVSISILAQEVPDIVGFFREFAYQIESSGGSVAAVFTELIVLLILGLFGYMLPFYGAISIGQFWKKHRVLGAVLAYIGFVGVSQFVTGYVLRFTLQDKLSYINRMAGWEFYQIWHSAMIPVIILAVLGGAACFLISNFALSRKLNLE